MPDYLRYRDNLEQPAADEAETIRKIIDVMATGQHNVRAKYGESVRVSHAKAHGFLRGELVVRDGLPPELRQGLFARAGAYPALVRLATAPGEMLHDGKVSTPRGMAIKVFDVDGPKLPGHEGQTTQDFVLDTGGPAFFVGGLKAFLVAFTPNATMAPKLPEGVKGLVSKVARAANVALHAVGLDSDKLDFYGHPNVHPLGQSYFSQVPLRYGDYVAKLSVTPANPALKALYDQKVDEADENALRTVTAAFFRDHAAEFDVNVQLAVDGDEMPIEDASVVWPEELSPYRPVAKLVLPPQDAYNEARQEFVDYEMSFAPSHSLAAHRPLGAIMRARLAVYPALADLRRSENGKPMVEPASVARVPG